MKKRFFRFNFLTPLLIALTCALVFRMTNIARFTTRVMETPLVLPAAAETHPDKGKAAATDPQPKADAPPQKEAGTKPEETEAKPAEAKAPEKPPTPNFSPAEIDVLQSLAQRRNELDQREAALTQREAVLKAAEQTVDQKIIELTRLKSDMENLLGQQQKAEESRILSLVKIYENMKPGDAARIFDQLDMNILLDVIGRMNERKISPILAGMNPERAKDVTIKLAEQKRLPDRGKAAVKEEAPPTTPPAAPH